jgi:putative hydrolase of the HAD superfamily
MFEDLPRNLVVPRLLGMKTVLILPLGEHKPLERWEIPDAADDNIDYMTSNLTAFLNAVL